ncbi:unnamed protein product, partial [Heterotrigona itama]
KSESIPDDTTLDEILKQARRAAKDMLKMLNFEMDFLRQKKDGNTSLQFIVPGDGVIPRTSQTPVSLVLFIGKLNNGIGSLVGFRENKRNMSNQETNFVYQTYADETTVQYAESTLDFAKSGRDHRESEKSHKKEHRLKEVEETKEHLEKHMQDVNRNIPTLDGVNVSID